MGREGLSMDQKSGNRPRAPSTFPWLDPNRKSSGSPLANVAHSQAKEATDLPQIGPYFGCVFHIWNNSLRKQTECSVAVEQSRGWKKHGDDGEHNQEGGSSSTSLQSNNQSPSCSL